jgi:site-specific recombinase XerD
MPRDASRSAALPAVVDTSRAAVATRLEDGTDLRHLMGSLAPGTLRAYRADWKQWCAWCDERGIVPLPADPSHVATHLEVLAKEGAARTTIRRRLAAIVKRHEWEDAPFNRAARALAAVIDFIARQHGRPVQKKAELSTEDVKAMLATIDRETLSGKREAALLLVGYAGGFRRSEVVGIQAGDIEWCRDGILVMLRRSKTDRAGEGQIVPIRYGRHERTCPVRALKAWIDARQARLVSADGPVFCRIRGDGTPAALSGEAYAELVKRLAAAIGLDPARYAGHSSRRGCATEADRRGADLQGVADQLRHRKLDTTREYINRGNLLKNSVSAKLGL